MQSERFARVVEWLWRRLPDRCEMPDCERRGVRGQETRVMVGGTTKRVCDDCRGKIMRKRRERAERDEIAAAKARRPK